MESSFRLYRPTYAFGLRPLFLAQPDNFSKKQKKHVRFDTLHNQIIYINGIDFYKQNDIKNNIWWTPLEIVNFRTNFHFEKQSSNLMQRCDSIEYKNLTHL